MKLFTWTPEYSVGAKAMDVDHQKLFDIMNKLYDISDNQNAQE